MDQNYQIALHLVGAGDQVVAQQDGVPDQGLTPTTRWLSGEIVVDRRVLGLSAVPPGEYRLVAGMYRSLENGYANLGDPIELGSVKVGK
jgi:hypothetical protein